MTAVTKEIRRYSYFMALRNAIFRYHKSNIVVIARADLEAELRAKFKSQAKINETLNNFDWYTADCYMRGNPTFQTRMNLTATLPQFVPADLTCGGQIGRVDLVKTGGFAVWLLRNEAGDNWQNELQSPLIQKAAAEQLNAEWSEVSVGIYSFGKHTVETRTYTDAEIQLADQSLEQLLRAMGY